MILPFSLQLNGMPTYFPAKILESLQRSNIIAYRDAVIAFEALYQKVPRELFDSGRGSEAEKKHTIRADEKERWKAGNLIHFVINNRRPDQFQFAPVVPCVSTQKIIIKWWLSKATGRYTLPYVLIDGKTIRGKALDQLAVNDGFASRKEFFEYFNTDFTGKIIHWTNLKY